MTEIKLYQINPQRDADGVLYAPFEALQSLQGSPVPDGDLYDLVWAGSVPDDDLESVYERFCAEPPADFAGRGMAVSDIVEVTKSDVLAPGCYYCNTVGFVETPFEPAPAREDRQMTVVLLEPGQYARLETVPTDLSSMQRIVGGLIEPVYCFSDEACLICNEEGKLESLPVNRALYGADGKVADVICGTAFICGTSSDAFVSLTAEQQEQYLRQFRFPERIWLINNEITAVPVRPEERPGPEPARGKER